jgi:hypothetical protein
LSLKNNYKICGDKTVIYLVKKDGTILETTISTIDLPKVKEFPNTWFGRWSNRTKSFYVHGNLPKKDGKRETVLLHRFILSANKDVFVDHINHDTLNNERENLRFVSNGENQHNRLGPRKDSKSGVRGVRCRKYKNKMRWEARIQVNKRSIHIGEFDTITEAANAVAETRRILIPNIK